MRLYLIKSGFFSCEGGAMFGIVPRRTWERRYPPIDGKCPMAMNLLLVDFGNRKVILDAGVGNKDLRKLRSYGFHSIVNLAEEVRSRGIACEEITDVILSHLHFDHCGGLTFLDENEELQITFPNATHWVSSTQFAHFQNPIPLDEDSYKAENVDLIHKRGLIRLVDNDQAIFEGFDLHLFEGHTPGQLVSTFDVNGERYAYVGDVVPTMAHSSPLWISPYDLYPVEAVSEKIRLLSMISDEDRIMVSFHDTYHPFAKVKRVGDRSFKAIPYNQNRGII